MFKEKGVYEYQEDGGWIFDFFKYDVKGLVWVVMCYCDGILGYLLCDVVVVLDWYKIYVFDKMFYVVEVK